MELTLLVLQLQFNVFQVTYSHRMSGKKKETPESHFSPLVRDLETAILSKIYI